MSQPLAFGWIVFLYRSAGDKPYMLNDDWCICLIRLLFGFKSLSRKAVIISQNQKKLNKQTQSLKYDENINLVVKSEYVHQTSKYEKTDLSNNKTMICSEKTDKKNVTFSQLLFRLMASIYLSHHFILLYLHFRTRQPILIENFDNVSDSNFYSENTFLILYIVIFLQILRTLVCLALSIPAGFIFYLFVNAPISNLVSSLIDKLNIKTISIEKYHKE